MQGDVPHAVLYAPAVCAGLAQSSLQEPSLMKSACTGNANYLTEVIHMSCFPACSANPEPRRIAWCAACRALQCRACCQARIKVSTGALTCRAATSRAALVSLILPAMAGSASTSFSECLYADDACSQHQQQHRHTAYEFSSRYQMPCCSTCSCRDQQQDDQPTANTLSTAATRSLPLLCR
jgi:hypothetical protein